MGKYNLDEIEHFKDGEVEYIKFKALKDIKHCITLRHGGVSKGIYESLNFRIAGKDEKENILRNIEIISNLNNFSDIYKARQSHSDNIKIINIKNKDEYSIEKVNTEEIDAYIVSEKEIATLITTADCNPIIIYDTENNVVANIHAGWKGVINKIYLKTIDIMKKEYSTKNENLIVCIGPSIRKCCFTSKEERFKELFKSAFSDIENYLEYETDGVTFHIDLIGILISEFNGTGIKKEQIHVADICTRCNHDDFFSYRYATQNNQEDYGTMATIVELK